MEYFAISQNEAYQNAVHFKVKTANPIQRRVEIARDDVKDIKGAFHFSVQSHENNFYPDILDIPIFMVSNKLVKVFKYFFETEDFRAALLSDRKYKQHRVYWIPILKKINCLHKSTEFLKD